MALEKFRYTSKDGVEIVLPKFSSAKSGLLRKLRKESEVEVIYSLLESLADEKNLALTDDLPIPELGEMYKAWQEDAGVTAGESSASSTS